MPRVSGGTARPHGYLDLISSLAVDFSKQKQSQKPGDAHFLASPQRARLGVRAVTSGALPRTTGRGMPPMIACRGFTHAQEGARVHMDK